MRSALSRFIPTFLWAAALIFALSCLVSGILPRKASQEALRYFDIEFLERAWGRANAGYVNSGLSALASFAVLYLFTRSSYISTRLWPAFRLSGDVTTRGTVLFGLILGIMASGLFALASLPFSAYGGFFLEKAFGMSRISFGRWLLDYAKGTLLDLVAYGAGGAFVAWVVFKFSRRWYIVTTVAFIAVSVVMAALYPLIIAPIFNEFYPLEDATLLEDVRRLSTAAGLEVDQVLVMKASAKTARVNAYFAGIGRTRQVVLYDTLIETRSPHEIRFVLAHELGHWKHGHVMWGTLLSGVGVMVCLILFRLAHPDTRVPLRYRDLETCLLALFAFIVLFSYIINPISSYVSRSFERTADAFALSLTQDSESFIRGQVNIARTNLTDVQPPPFIRWFAWTHPTTIERILSAE
ncbi:MAG: M48 family metallopeptidase [Bacillota bacterium]|nr:M48 family metallopeptidase [Candidatus Fermentithermobacillaceae bacterium]